MNFYELGLKPEILQAVSDLGFEHPTPIQEKGIPELITGKRDAVGLAQTGTGKTAAFGLPLLQLIDFGNHLTQGLILCPTRELCLQITNDLKTYARYVNGARITAVYGGENIREQFKRLKNGAQIIVATPGRLMDLMRRGAIRLNSVDYVVLDEADEMLNMGFQEDIDTILQETPAEKRTWLFSATMPKTVERISRNYMKNPVEISVGTRNMGAENITHNCYVMLEKDRYVALKRIIDYYPEIFGLIFCRTREETRIIAEKLMKDGYNAEALHGDLSQTQRDYVMKKFREKSIQLLVATDVAARGLDVDDISHVINYNLPDEPGIYTHRSGRTARAGKSGVSSVLINTRERSRIGYLAQKNHMKFNFVKIPEGRAICEKQLFALVEKMVHVDVNETEIEPYLKPVFAALEDFSKEDIIRCFVSAEFNRFLDYYRDAGNINPIGKSAGKPGGKPAGKPGPKSKGRSDARPDFRSDTRSNNRPDTRSNPRPDFRSDTRKNEKPPRREKDRKSSGLKMPAKKDAQGASRSSRMETQRFFINVGEMDNLKEGAIVRLVCDRSGITSDKIGNISLRREYSFFDVEKDVAKSVLKSLKGATLDGHKITAAFAEKDKEGKAASGRSFKD